MFTSLTTCTAPGGNFADVVGLACVPTLFHNVVNAFLIFSGVVAIFLLTYAGIRLITSGGDPKQVTAARQIMTYTIIGLVVILTSFGLVSAIGYFTKSTACITNPLQILNGC